MRKAWDKGYLKECLLNLFEEWYHKEVETYRETSRGMMGESGSLIGCNTMELLNDIMWKFEFERN